MDRPDEAKQNEWREKLVGKTYVEEGDATATSKDGKVS